MADPVPAGLLFGVWDETALEWVEVPVVAEAGWRDVKTPIVEPTRSYNRRLARHALASRNRQRTVTVRTPELDRPDALTLIAQLKTVGVREVGGELVGDVVENAVITGVRLRQNEYHGIAGVECVLLFERNEP